MKIKNLNSFNIRIHVTNEVYDYDWFEILENENLTLMKDNEHLFYQKWSEVQNDFEDLFFMLKDYSNEINSIISYDIIQADKNVFNVSLYKSGNIIMMYKIILEFSE